MKNIKVTFKTDMELCFDGVNPKTYKAGKVYSPTHAHEAKMFEAFLADGRAQVPQEKVSEPQQEKVIKPKARKKK